MIEKEKHIYPRKRREKKRIEQLASAIDGGQSKKYDKRQKKILLQIK